MNRRLWERIQELLPLLRELAPERREDFLRAHCAGEPELERELRRLLVSASTGFLEPPELLGEERPSLAPGARIAEFEILRELGRGGMGIVYLARQASLGRQVALKVLPAGLFPADERLSRFRVEALAAARLQHPSIVHVFSAGAHGGYRYIAMEFIDGGDLAVAIAQLRGGRSAPPGMPPFEAPGYTRRVAEIVRAIADALEYAHGHGILHRDVKPQNILLERAGGVFLVDFGLAKDLGADSISVSGQILGTPYYMSPEQALARRVDIDHRTDVFSLGAVLYELLTLERPFLGDSVRQVLNAISFSEPVGIRKRNVRVHRDLETICFKALEKAPERRFASAGAFARELARFLANEPLSIRRSWPVERLVRRIRRNRPATALGGVLLASAAAVPLVWRAARAAEVDDVIVRAERALADPAATADELRADLERLQQAASSAGPALAPRLTAAIEAIQARGREQAGLWRAALARGLEADGPGSWERSDAALAEARRHLFEARLLLPGDPELAAAEDVGLPSVTLVGTPDGLRVAVRAIDPLTGIPGPRRELGRTPLDALALGRGHYVFEIRAADGSACELTRLLDRPGMRLELRPRLRPTSEVTRGMLAIPGTRLELALQDRGPLALALEPFWIDATEVTIAQYRAFLRDSGHPPPQAWTLPAFRERCEALLQPSAAVESATPWDDLPMGGVTLEEARAYAEWYGKRLPTVFEFDLAARGPELRRYPWTRAEALDVAEVLAHAVVRDPGSLDSAPGQPRLDGLADYLAHVLPVRSRPEGRSPFGLFHAYGNVKEWTSTLALTLHRDRAGDPVRVPELATVLIRGKGWDSPAARSGEVFDLEHFDRIHVNLAPFSLGFRCVKSAP